MTIGLLTARTSHSAYATLEKGNVFTLRLTQIKNNAPVDDSMFLKFVVSAEIGIRGQQTSQ